MSQPTKHDRLPIGVCAYTFPCSCGSLRRDGQSRPDGNIDAWQLISIARESGLSSVEMPLRGMLPDLDESTIDRLRATLADADLTLVVDTGVVEVEELQVILPLAARAGARVVRATVSKVLEGARGTVPGGWDAHLEEITRRIVAVRPLLEQYDLTLALENHQDATSDDLIALCAAGGDRVGVTLDAANPLAVGEEPLQFARKLGPLIQNVHLKDYRIFPTPSGFRLVRSALGEGTIPFEQLLPLLREVAPGASLQIELAALFGRHIRLLEDDWWEGFPPRDARDVVPALRFMMHNVDTTGEDWQTPWEREAPVADVARYEREQFDTSVRYLRSLTGMNM